VLIQADWPPRIPEGSSDTVVLSLIQTREQFFIARVEREGQTAVPATLVPRGTPDVPYTRSYGPGYKLVSASASLTAPNIDIVPLGETTQTYPLDEAKIGWVWSISPRTQGKQVMVAEVRFRWESDTGEPPREFSVWQYTLDTFVDPPMHARPMDVTLATDTPSPQAAGDTGDPVGFWADALQVVTGLGAVIAFAGGALRWGLSRTKGLWKGTGPS
jgi:hypothetical protein